VVEEAKAAVAVDTEGAKAAVVAAEEEEAKVTRACRCTLIASGMTSVSRSTAPRKGASPKTLWGTCTQVHFDNSSP